MDDSCASPGSWPCRGRSSSYSEAGGTAREESEEETKKTTRGETENGGPLVIDGWRLLDSSYTWSSSRCKSLGVFQIASLLDLCLSLVSLFSQHWACLLPDVVVPLFPLLCIVCWDSAYFPVTGVFGTLCFVRTSQFHSSRDLAQGRVQNFTAICSSYELSSHQISTRTGSSKPPRWCQPTRAELSSNPLGAPSGEEVQNFTAGRSSSELGPHQISIRALSGVCVKTRLLSRGSSTTAAKGLSYCVRRQVHPPRHRRRRGTVPAHVGESATTAYFGCMELLLPLALSGQPLRLRVVPCSSMQL